MSNKVVVAGVGMIPFSKPGANDDYATMGARAARAALADARIDYALIGQAYAGYVFGDSACGQAAIYGVGLTGIPDRQCQQQRRDRVDGALPCPSGRGERCSRVRDCARLRADGTGRAERCLHGPSGTDGALRQDDDGRPGYRRSGTARGAAFRRRGTRVHERVRHQAGNLRPDLREGAPACRQQSVRGVPHSAHARRSDGFAGGVRSAHAPAMLPADLRRRSGDPVLGGLCPQAWPRYASRDRARNR